MENVREKITKTLNQNKQSEENNQGGGVEDLAKAASKPQRSSFFESSTHAQPVEKRAP